MVSNSTESPPIPFETITTLPPCQWILFKDINGSGVKWWDVLILIPNIIFMVFLLLRLPVTIRKLHSTSTPIFAAFYGLILLVSIISLLRCVVAMTVNASISTGIIVDKILWLILKFFLLATELSVVIFGLAFGHLDSRTSIQRVLFVTFSVSLAYSIVQGSLEFEYDHPFTPGNNSNINNSTVSYDMFAQGGMIFLFTTSIFFALVYAIIVILPFTRFRERFFLPTKRLFYYYCSSLAMLNLAQAVASILHYLDVVYSLCVIDATMYLYFSFYNPLVYGVFLWKFFKATQSGVPFSYKHHEDVIDDEHVILPYSNGATAIKQEEQSPIYSYNSTHFDVPYSPNRRGSSSSDLNSSFKHSVSINSDYYNISVDT
ncbi:transmembrane protein adipocyte-associated 1 [Biomphalaria pfeifferi]|uniref:Transmembrane protein adipocyte-associated 1 n=1 Tax=Biomphalaria pfeifferi TaxID=112525 RepID=A0AAD8C1Z5_BIOPF|nr:transmembrane protein adipocyte-associated 1 [Biomphalaria pfeifferi]